MTRECLSYFGSLGINVNEVYGMSESCGATTFSTDEAHEWGSVGFEMPGTEVKCFRNEGGKMVECPKADSILTPTEEQQGEICFRGRHIMMGYMAQPKLGQEHVDEINQKNADAIDSDGWMHSGDKGCISKRGMVRITGRYKELIIGAGGENIAPVPIEDNMKKLCPFISNIMMYGDKKKFNVCLISLKCVGATGEVPGTNKLDGAAKQFGNTIEEACNNPAFVKAVSDAIVATGKNGECTPSNAAKIQKFTVIPADFSVETDELTATLKLKRSVVEKKYQDILDHMYESKETFVPYSNVGSYDVKAGTASELSGSFKAVEPLTMVDDDTAKEVAAAEAASAE
jgi:long-chain-fatty-acid--CoA ligase ACSBG